MERKNFIKEAGLAQDKDELLALLLEEEGIDLAADEAAIAPRKTAENLPLSYTQQAQWFLHQLEPNNPFYNICATVQLEGILDVAALDLTRDRLLRITLLQLGQASHVLVLVIHHMVSDGFTLGVLMRELGALYDAFVSSEPAALPVLSIQYADYAVWQREWLRGERRETLLSYWKEQLDGMPSLLTLPSDRPRPPVQTFRGDMEPFQLDLALTQQLRKLSQTSGCTLFMTLLSAFAVLLHRYSGQSDIVVGSPIANRNRPELENLIGFFANSLVLRTQFSQELTFREMLAQVQAVTLDAYAHQDFPFETLVEELQPERDLNSNPLFQVIFALQNASLPSIELPNLTMTPAVNLDTGTVRSDLEVHLWEGADGIRGGWVYSTDLFEKTTIQRLAAHFHTLLEAIVADPDQLVSMLPLLTSAERHQLLVEWNDAQAESRQGWCIHHRFEAQVEQTPNAIALVSVTQSFTYAALNDRANQLAHYLQTLGVGPETRVGICLERSLDWVVALLGVLKASGAYVPIDPAYPQKYIAKCLNAAQPSVLLTHQRLCEALSIGNDCAKGQPTLQADGVELERVGDAHPTDSKLQVICLDTDWLNIAQQPKENPSSQTTPGNLAYVMTSSGAENQIEHRSVSRRLDWLQTTFALSETDGVLCQSSPSQDAVVRELFWPLATGARVVLADDDSEADLLALMVSQQISVAGFAPSDLSTFVESLSPAVKLKSLRLLLCSGEPLSGAIVEALSQHYSGQIYHLYSLPEAAGEVAAFDCQSASGKASAEAILPVGHPTCRSVYVLDSHWQPVPLGVVGEIYVGGAGLAPEEFQAKLGTASGFVENPFSDIPGDRLFKTGELGCLRDLGLERVGSLNRQVWIKGFKVDLAEVEAALMQAPEVIDCRVLMRQSEPDGPQLVAYMVASGQFSPEQLSFYLQSQLPSHMLPSAYAPIANLPLTAVGEVDEQALAALPVIDPDLIQRWEACLNAQPDIEQVAVWVQEQIERTPPLHLSDLLPAGDIPTALVDDKTVTAPVVQAPESVTSEHSVLALSDGGPLTLPSGSPKTLAEALIQTAAD